MIGDVARREVGDPDPAPYAQAAGELVPVADVLSGVVLDGVHGAVAVADRRAESQERAHNSDQSHEGDQNSYPCAYVAGESDKAGRIVLVSYVERESTLFWWCWKSKSDQAGQPVKWVSVGDLCGGERGSREIPLLLPYPLPISCKFLPSKYSAVLLAGQAAP